MSEATCGGARDIPGYRCAHPGYALSVISPTRKLWPRIRTAPARTHPTLTFGESSVGFTNVSAGTTPAGLQSRLHHFPDWPTAAMIQVLVQNLVGGLHDMHEHPGRAVDAAVQLHEHLEQLSSQLSELESLRARVLEAERRALITEERVGFSHREAGAAG